MGIRSFVEIFGGEQSTQKEIADRMKRHLHMSGSYSNQERSDAERPADSYETPATPQEPKKQRNTVLSRYQKKFGLFKGTSRYFVQRVSADMYLVKDGDSLFGIAENTYGNGAEWGRLAEVNI